MDGPTRRPAATSSRRAGPLLLALLAALGVVCATGSVRAQSPPPALADEDPRHPHVPPPALAEGRLDPDWGVQFGLGFPFMEVDSRYLSEPIKGGTPTSRGVYITVQAALKQFRLGYVRHLYRAPLPVGATFAGAGASDLAFDSDQLWAFHGIRPLSSLYLGYGLGWQYRQVRVLREGTTLLSRTEHGALAGLMVDWAVGLPFSLQLRMFQHLGDDLIRERGASLQLSYLAGF